jgi:outer membrane protein assembly factor BamB
MKDNRNTVVAFLALALMVIVMAAAAYVTFSGAADRDRVILNGGWQVEADTAASVNITDFTGDGQRDIFVQDNQGVRILDAGRNTVLDRSFTQPMASTQGDADDDGIPDILVYTWNGESATAQLFNGNDENIWQTTVPELGRPGRAVALDFENDGVHEFVLGDENGHLVALSSRGEFLWRHAFFFDGTLRGLDEVAYVGGDLVVAGLEEGLVHALDRRGQLLWQEQAFGGLRRLRAFPLVNPQEGLVFIGSVSGELSVHDGRSGAARWSVELGQAVNEIRPVEIDGNPATKEVAAGGKDGGVWAIDMAGRVLWSGFMSDKVTEIGSLNSKVLDSQVIIFGDDAGNVAAFDESGQKVVEHSLSGSVSRIDVGKVGDESGFIVAAGGQMRYFTIEQETAPFWYSPVIAGVLACLIIAAVAFALTRLKLPPQLQVSAQEMTVEAQRARRRMLHENIHDLKSMESRGEVAPAAFLARMKELRGRLAESNEALMKLGEPIRPETFSCPHCNGTLELGTDRCDYCGQIVIV